jgi:hypothetical protein
MPPRLAELILRKARSLANRLYPHRLLKWACDCRQKKYGNRLFWQGYRHSVGIEAPTAQQVAREQATDTKNDLEKFFDARTTGPGVWKWRHYFEIYDKHFNKFRGKNVRVLEIGIYSGGSLEMWADYFGPQSQIFGMDIEESCRVYEKGNVKIFIGDQSDSEFWRKLRSTTEPFDIVIDDGGHLPHQQQVTLEGVLGHLNPGGVYLCEDIAGKLNPFHGYLNGLTRSLHDNETYNGIPGTAPNAFQQLVKSVHYYPFVVVIEINAERVQNFTAPRHGTQWQPFFD